MLPTKIYTLTLAANESRTILVQGQLFKLIAAAGSVSVQSDFGRLDDLIEGQGLANTPFLSLLLTNTSGTSNSIRLLIGDENFIDASVSQKAPRSGNFSNASRTVTSASAQISAANVDRQYLLIQNNDGAGYLYIAYGSAATLANGIKIPPGGSFEQPNTQSKQAIYAIGDIASNANVVIVEG